MCVYTHILMVKMLTVAAHHIFLFCNRSFSECRGGNKILRTRSSVPKASCAPFRPGHRSRPRLPYPNHILSPYIPFLFLAGFTTYSHKYLCRAIRPSKVSISFSPVLLLSPSMLLILLSSLTAAALPYRYRSQRWWCTVTILRQAIMVQLRTSLEIWCCDKTQSIGTRYVIPASPLGVFTNLLKRSRRRLFTLRETLIYTIPIRFMYCTRKYTHAHTRILSRSKTEKKVLEQPEHVISILSCFGRTGLFCTSSVITSLDFVHGGTMPLQ